MSDDQAAIILDLNRRTFSRWKAGGVGRIGRDGKARLSNLLGIHKALRIVFRDAARGHACPEDWPLLIAAEQKTNPRLMSTLGALDLVPAARRAAGAGATCLMAPFTHASQDRPSRFADGSYGVLYLAKTFETALFETMHHHVRFMARTAEPPGWTSQFRELVLDLDAALHDLRGDDEAFAPAPDPDHYDRAQHLAAALRLASSEGLACLSRRDPSGQYAALFYPDRVASPAQGRRLDYNWDGRRIDLYRDAGRGKVYRVGAR